MTITVSMSTVPQSDSEAALPASLSARLDKNRSGKDLLWANINFTVGNKSILSDCWGEVRSGEIVAMMGPSGAGKSSLLNVLAGRSSSAPGIAVEGLVMVEGREINPVAYRRNIAYVMQDDALMPTATPREALRFSARLRLPSSVSDDQIEETVTFMLESLGLTECADVLVGGALIKGISGGQRKRTSVGVEIVTRPDLLFLDEPTSGLDSFSAFSLIKLLKQVAATNCAILCTIHQPSSEVFFLFDSVVFMKDGRIFYQGYPADIVSFYSQRGFECPDNYNPSDFVMDLCQRLDAAELEQRQLFVPKPARFSGDSVLAKRGSQQYASSMVDFHFESSFLEQSLALVRRELVNTQRDTMALIARFGITIVLNLLYGLIFYNACGRDNADQDNYRAHVGAISMVVIFVLFGPAQSVLLTFPFERPMILREYATGTYSVEAYFLSRLLVEAPITMVQIIIAFALVYNLMDMQGNFGFMVLTCWGLAMVSNSVAFGLGAAVPDVKDVTELAPIIYVPQILFGGFFIRTSRIPVFLRWAQFLCSLKYSMNLMLLTEFRRDRPTCSSSDEAASNCRQILEDNSIDGQIFFVYIVLLFVLFAAFRLLSVIVLKQKAKRFY